MNVSYSLFLLFLILEEKIMKVRVLLLAFVMVVVLSSVQAVVLDSFTLGSILDPSRDPLVGPGRWHDERDEVWPPTNSALKESAFSHDGDGSMMVDYGYWADPFPPAPAGDPYDRVPRGYFEGEDYYAEPLPDVTGKQFTFWWYKSIAEGPETVREFQIYSPDGMARFSVATGGEGNPGSAVYNGMTAGWQFVTTAAVGSVDWIYEGSFDATAVTTIDFWCSAWYEEWVEVTPGNWEAVFVSPPTGAPVYIDDLQLIPEPATMILLGLGGLTMLRRRKA